MIDNKTIRKVIMLNKCLKGGSPTYENREASGAVANFTTNVVMPFVSLECEILPIQEGTGTPSPSNPRPISGTSILDIYHSGADTSDYDTISVNLGQEIMGGTADVVEGIGEETYGKVDMGDLMWNKASGYYYSTSLRELVKPEGTGLCETLKNAQSGDNTFRFTNNGDIIVISATYNAMTKEEFIEDVANVKLVYELATPTPFTFTWQPINSYLGTNNVWTKVGDTKVTYKYMTGEGGSSNKKYLPIFYEFYRKEIQTKWQK